MGDYVLLDESHLSFRIPNDLDDASCDAIRRILENRPFRSALRRTVLQLDRECMELAPIRIRIAV